MEVVGLVLQRLLDPRSPGIDSAGIAEFDVPLACGSLGRRRRHGCDEQRTKTGTEQRRCAVITIGCAGTRIDGGGLIEDEILAIVPLSGAIPDRFPTEPGRFRGVPRPPR